MNVRKSCLVASLLVALAWAACPGESHAQVFRGRGYAAGGRGYTYGGYGYGYGYPGYYGTGWGGTGVAVGVGPRYWSPYSSYGYGYNGNYYYNNSPSIVS